MKTASQAGSVHILGIRVNDVTMEETLALCASWIASGRPHQIVTVNPEFVMAAQHNADFRVTLQEADLAIPDGAGLLWASRAQGQPLRERVAGSDLVPRLAAASAQKGYRLYLLGAAPGVAERAARVLAAEYPEVNIVGTFAGSPAPEQEDDIVAKVRAADPDVLFVAYGAPKQDLWIRRNAERLGVPLCIGVGGAFDFIAGITRRAPLWMQQANLEWLYRLIQEPWRWRRMLALPEFAWAVLRSARGRDK